MQQVIETKLAKPIDKPNQTKQNTDQNQTNPISMRTIM